MAKIADKRWQKVGTAWPRTGESAAADRLRDEGAKGRKWAKMPAKGRKKVKSASFGPRCAAVRAETLASHEATEPRSHEGFGIGGYTAASCNYTR
jgi:hypothetical protein